MDSPPCKIDWTRQALDSLTEIFEFLEETMGFEKANARMDAIFEKAEKLSRFPEMGSIERQGSTPQLIFRYLLEGHYKILYTYHREANTVEIRQVFDNRQNPDHLRNS